MAAPVRIRRGPNPTLL